MSQTDTSPRILDRTRMRSVANSAILHVHPTRVAAPALRLTYTWGLGGISALLAFLLVLTGVLLMFRYEPTIAGAYDSVQRLETEVMFGSLLRGLHHWSANLLVITAFLHLLRVFFTGGFKAGRSLNWLIGLALLLLVLAANFTGYLLPWDQLSYWAVTVGTSLLDYLPLVGPALHNFALGGREVGQRTLDNFYAFHVALLPVILVLTLLYHFWRIRKDGGISQPAPEAGARVRYLTTLPHLVQRELAAGAAVAALLLLWAMLVPAPLGALADPTQSPNPAKAAWYFLGLQELLLHMHPLAVMVLLGLVAGGFLWLPQLDGSAAQIGRYFRSPIGRRVGVLGALTALYLLPLLVLIDELWLDWSALLPGQPVFVATGIVPLLGTLLGLGGLYALFLWVAWRTGRRAGQPAGRPEALVGLFAFLMTSLVVMTAIGLIFRGPNMALIWPF